MTTRLWHELEDKQAESVVGGWQEVKNTKITSVSIPWPGLLEITINKKIPQDIGICQQGKFTADMGDGSLFEIAKDFQKAGKAVTVRFAEFECYQGTYPGSRSPDTNPLMLLGIYV